MKEDLLKIIDHYGIDNQLRKFNEESFELQEAIITYETEKSVNYIYLAKEGILEELADCYVMLEQLRNYYEISDDELKSQMRYKIDRQLERIKNEEKEIEE